jgi:hypothetical protein
VFGLETLVFGYWFLVTAKARLGKRESVPELKLLYNEQNKI